MIAVALTRFDEGFIYTVSGHAGYDKYGKDIICAAVSMLTLTVAERLKECDDIESSITVRSGSAHIHAMGNVTEIYQILRCGLELLQHMDMSENWLKIRVNDKIEKV